MESKIQNLFEYESIALKNKLSESVSNAFTQQLEHLIESRILNIVQKMFESIFTSKTNLLIKQLKEDKKEDKNKF